MPQTERNDKMKGYKAANGNYITGREIEKAQRKWKQEKQEYRKQREEEEKRQELINIAKYRQEREDQRQYQEKQKRVTESKDQILLSLRKENPFTYRQYLIIWDIITVNYIQILSDIQREKITLTEVKNAINYIEQFSREIIEEYWKNRLLETA